MLRAVVILIVASGVVPANAAPKKPSALASELVKQLAIELASDKDEVATAAAKRLGDTGGAQAADALVRALAVGMAPIVAAEALGALGTIADARVLPVLTLYAGNVNAPVRLAAVKALGRVREAKATEILIDRLGDGESAVRAAAAEALAERKEARAVPRLFRLVARNDAGAAGPLGMLIAADAVPRLAELQGLVDEAVLATALGEFVKRPEAPDRLRLDVIRQLGRLPGASATAALVEYLAAVPENEARPSKDEAQKLIDARGSK